jgi:hypothetical protein
MVHIFIDIENTLIDDLFSCNLLQEQCDRVKNFIWNEVLSCYSQAEVGLFTWGWKTKEEIRPEIVDWLFGALDIPKNLHGPVLTKDDSIECAYRHNWVNTKDEVELEDLHIPGAMKRFGLEKQTCFVQQAKDMANFPEEREALTPTDLFILIDDTNEKGIIDRRTISSTRKGDTVKIEFRNPEDL